MIKPKPPPIPPPPVDVEPSQSSAIPVAICVVTLLAFAWIGWRIATMPEPNYAKACLGRAQVYKHATYWSGRGCFVDCGNERIAEDNFHGCGARR